ncbi:uncharacterized protein EI90DRAFT_3115266 [Cantharellus anzutake]|uniref:uncharacterized protein n=1 Tax=Cantharellus anzutake TaxID=1750568 RepID=UPI001906A5AE|nr:uncharacterized protein EI90DRAFT_3115266 [Cantharellus anzutake]KAF8342705.1 hypothetical protein EI90DRAFT_3115266 [Cantharellus anzutake]
MDQTHTEHQHHDFVTDYFSLRGPRVTPEFEFAIQMSLFLKDIECALDDMLFSLDLGNGETPSAIVKTPRPINLVDVFSHGYLFITGEETPEDLAIIDYGSFHELYFVQPCFGGADPPHSLDEWEIDPYDLGGAYSSQDEESLDTGDVIPSSSPNSVALDFVGGCHAIHSPPTGSAGASSPLESNGEITPNLDVQYADNIGHAADRSVSFLSTSLSATSSLFSSQYHSNYSLSSGTSTYSPQAYTIAGLEKSMSGLSIGGSYDFCLARPEVLGDLESPACGDINNIDMSVDMHEISDALTGRDDNISHISSSPDIGAHHHTQNNPFLGASMSAQFSGHGDKSSIYMSVDRHEVCNSPADNGDNDSLILRSPDTGAQDVRNNGFLIASVSAQTDCLGASKAYHLASQSSSKILFGDSPNPPPGASITSSTIPSAQPARMVKPLAKRPRFSSKDSGLLLELQSPCFDAIYH